MKNTAALDIFKCQRNAGKLLLLFLCSKKGNFEERDNVKE